MVQSQDTDKNTSEAITTASATSSSLLQAAAATTTTSSKTPPPTSTQPAAVSSTSTSVLLPSMPPRNESGLLGNTEPEQQQQHRRRNSFDLGTAARKLVVDEEQEGLEFKSSTSDDGGCYCVTSTTISHLDHYPSSSSSSPSSTTTTTTNIMKGSSTATATTKTRHHHYNKNSNPNKDAATTAGNNHRRVSFATNAHQISSVPSSEKGDANKAAVVVDHLIPLKNAASSSCSSVSAAAKAAMRSLTPDTFSDASSATSGDGPWEVIEYDPSDQVHSLLFGSNDHGGGNDHDHDDDLNDHDAHHHSHHHRRDRSTDTGGLSATLTTATPTDDDDDDDETEEILRPGIITAEAPAIEENTPAAEALKASASVRVSRVGKAARAVHMQAVRKLVKRATGTTRSGVVKGKPPRLPPHCPPHVTKQTLPPPSTTLPPPPPTLQVPQAAARVGGAGGGAGDDLSDLIEDDQEFAAEEDLEAANNDNDDDDDNHSSQSLNDGGGAINESQFIQQHADEQQQQKKLHHDDLDNDDDDEEGRVKDRGLEHTSGDGEINSIQTADEAAAAERRRLFQQQQQHDHQNTPLPDNVVQGTVEAGKKVLGAVDPHDMLKLLRWRKKRSGSDTSSKTKSYVKGKVIDGEHELYTLSIAVMIGVRTSISKTNIILNSGPGKRWVHPMDFRTTEKYEFRPKGGTGMPAHQLAHTFKFKDYSPVVFAYLRRMYGINEFDFLISVCANANFIEFISNARSGQFFFYSSDGRYMIKTMTNAESKFLRRILPDYFRHCCKNPNTMITRFFGMYRVKLYHLRRNVKFVIMNSVYYTDKYLQTFYDLKGSSVGRDAKPGQAVLKDNDLRRGLPDEALALSPETRARVRQQVESDCNFLTKMQIMDYSMLVGVHHVPPTIIHTVPTAASSGGGGDDFDNNIATTGFQGSRRRITSDASETMVNNIMENHNHADHDHLDAMRSSESILPSHFAPPGAPPPHHSDVDFFYDDGLDDDESSYLQGSDNRQRVPGSSGTRMSRSVACDTELKKMATIEKLYWPFHRLYDIHGHRRLEPALCTICGSKPCDCKADPSLLGFHIAEFAQPLSDRKDGGLEMDTSCLTLPMIYKGPQGDSLMYEGKIFYMGIIDILQEYNSRKLLESHYRLMQTSGKYEASCVAPSLYAERFLSFFDEFTKCDMNHRRRRLLGKLKRDDDDEKEKDSGVEMTLELHSSRSMIEL